MARTNVRSCDVILTRHAAAPLALRGDDAHWWNEERSTAASRTGRKEKIDRLARDVSQARHQLEVWSRACSELLPAQAVGGKFARSDIEPTVLVNAERFPHR